MNNTTQYYKVQGMTTSETSIAVTPSLCLQDFICRKPILLPFCSSFKFSTEAHAISLFTMLCKLCDKSHKPRSMDYVKPVMYTILLYVLLKWALITCTNVENCHICVKKTLTIIFAAHVLKWVILLKNV